jgi:hypothetical protein
MDARFVRTVALVALLLVSMGARYPSTNFIVETPDPALAAKFAQAAEKYRHDLAVEWLGQAMPNWAQPCMMTVQVGPNLGAGGATTFVFDHGEVFGWRMNIQGSAERLLDSVIPHEVTHMIFASYFRRPLPRWADEGGATSVECASEKTKHRAMLLQFLRSNRGIAFSQMFAMTEYPRDVMPLYAQAYSLADYMIMRGGRRKYVEFLGEGMETGNWPVAVHRHYGIADLGTLQNTWVAWVGQGFPEPKPAQNAVAARAASTVAPTASTTASSATGTSLAASGRTARPQPNLLYHVSDKTGSKTLAAKPGQGTAASGPAGDAVAPMDRAATAAYAAQPLSSANWHEGGPPPGAVVPPPPTMVSVPPSGPTQVTRPPAMQPAREMVLE